MLFSHKTIPLGSFCVIVFVLGVTTSDVIGSSTNQTSANNDTSVEATTREDYESTGITLTSDTCVSNNHCENGGSCVYGIGCQCRKGTSGSRCEVVEECISKCGGDLGTQCFYNVTEEAVECKCFDRTNGFDSDLKKCKDCNCGESELGCKFLPGGDKMCYCYNYQYQRDGKCEDCDCGIGSKGCRMENGTKLCHCLMSYLNIEGTCKEDCREGSDYACQNGGSCVDNACRCVRGTRGRRCEIVEGCDSWWDIFNKCGSSVSVECRFNVTYGKPYCGCKEAGYVFIREDKECKEAVLDSEAFQIDLCYAEPCGIHGTCKIEGDDFKCNCTPPYSGKTCGLGPCTLNPCLNEGECKVTTEGYKCACKDGYFGDHCEKDHCVSNDQCENGGSCVIGVGCQCRYGTSGHRCEVVDLCIPKCGDDPGTLCVYNVTEEAVECKCSNHSEGFDPDLRKCRECYCGERNLDCKFLPGGDEVCYCYYYQEDGKCEACLCGMGYCRMENGTKFCDCFEKYVDVGGICQECDCGPHGNCSFVNGEKTCDCEKGYAHRPDTGQCEACECGHFSWGCKFKSSDEKECGCNSDYSQKGDTCSFCDCGPNGMCSFNNEGKKVCTCYRGASDNDGYCTRCTCYLHDLNNVNCSFSDGRQKCHCPQGYEERVPKNCLDINECLERFTCPLNTECVNTEGSYVCNCKKGFKPYNEDQDMKRYGCIDINECTEQNECPFRDTTECVNTVGSYYCECKSGYSQASGTDIEEKGCQENQTGWKIGYIWIIVIVAGFAITMLVAIYRKRLVSPVSK